SDSSISGQTQYACRPARQASAMRATVSTRRGSGTTTVCTGVRPGGSSSMTEMSRSAYAVMARVRGMGVAVMISWCGTRPSFCPFSESLRRCCTPKRCCSSTMTSARRANSMPSWKSACVPITTRTSPEAIASSALRRVRAGLGPGEPERQRPKEAPCESWVVGERPGRVGLERALAELQGEVVREQLLEGQAPLCRVAAGGELGEARLARRVVKVDERFLERRQARRQGGGSRQPVAQRRALELVQRLLDERAQAPLRHAFGERIDRGEGLLERHRRPGEAPVLRVHHLEAERAAAHLAEAAQPRAAREPLLLAGREVEEPQRQHPRAVGDAREELAAAAVGDLGELDL